MTESKPALCTGPVGMHVILRLPGSPVYCLVLPGESDHISPEVELGMMNPVIRGFAVRAAIAVAAVIDTRFWSAGRLGCPRWVMSERGRG